MKISARLISMVLGASILILVSGASCISQGTTVTQTREKMRMRIESAVANTLPLRSGKTSLRASEQMIPYYQKMSFQPVWVADSGPLPAARQLLEVFRSAGADGLNPGDYNVSAIDSMLGSSKATGYSPETLVDIEFLLTDSWLLFAGHILNGRISPESYDPQWKIERGEADVMAIFEKAVTENRPVAILNSLYPQNNRYMKLKEALAEYRDISSRGGWPSVPEGKTLKKGDTDQRLIPVRKRLAAEGFLQSSLSVRDVFDDELFNAVIDFQNHYGLEPDGAIGPGTIKAMNVPADRRARQIAISMERWRWLPRELGDKYIRVNIANFKLAVIEQDRSVLDMKVIIGRTYRKTPVFSGAVSYVVLSPYWNVTRNIAVNDKLSQIKKDPGYLAKNNMKLFNSAGAPVDPKTVDWSMVNANNFSYRIRQDPGPENALGKVKFMFPNKYNVYMHDTPSRELFDKTVRTFSSGCIRIQKPVELAEYLLKEDPEWPPEKINATIARGIEKAVYLKKPVPVYILYLTVLVNEDGSIDFRDDIYERDAKVDEALKKILPQAG